MNNRGTLIAKVVALLKYGAKYPTGYPAPGIIVPANKQEAKLAQCLNAMCRTFWRAE